MKTDAEIREALAVIERSIKRGEGTQSAGAVVSVLCWVIGEPTPIGVDVLGDLLRGLNELETIHERN